MVIFTRQHSFEDLVILLLLSSGVLCGNKCTTQVLQKCVRGGIDADTDGPFCLLLFSCTATGTQEDTVDVRLEV